MNFAAKKKTGIIITGGLLALSVALTGCAGSSPDMNASPTASPSDTLIPQMILGVDPASVPVSDEISKKFGERAKSLGTFALTLTQASTGIPTFQDPAHVAAPEDAKLLMPFKDMMTSEAYANLTTQLATGDLKLIPNTNKDKATIEVDGKKYTQQGKEFGFTYGDITFDPIQGAGGDGIMMKQEVKVTIPTNEGNVVVHTDKRQVILEPDAENDKEWNIATWRVERTTEAS